MNADNRYPWLPLLGFICVLLIGSLDTALKYGGVIGVITYTCVGGCALYLWVRAVLPAFLKLPARTANILSFLLLVFVIATVLIVFPFANHSSPGGGGDSDDALVTAARELFNGRYPYYPVTYLGNPISPMPGAVLLSLPFALTGVIQLQNIFWLVIFFFLIRRIFDSTQLSLGLLLTILIASPTVAQNLVTGSDHASNSIYLPVFMWLLVHVLLDSRTHVWQRVGVAVLLGIGFSSRSNFLLLAPLLFSILVQTAGWKNALTYSLVCGLSFLAVTLPFWLYDAAHFAPLIAQSAKIRSLESVIPHAGIVIPAAGFGLASLLSFQTMRSDCQRFFRNCAIVQIAVLIITCTLYSIQLGRLDLYIGQSGYGLFQLFLGAAAGWMALHSLPPAGARSYQLESIS